MAENCIYSYETSLDNEILLDPSADHWKQSSEKAAITRLWNGKSPVKAAQPVGAEAASLWKEKALYFFFRCSYEKLFVNREYPDDRSVEGLWDFDVAEVFLKPEGAEGYFEYEVSPLSQYLAAHIITPWRNVNFAWESGMSARAEVEEASNTWSAVISLPFENMARAEVFRMPEPGDIWRVNLLLALGAEPARHYMCWQPTMTSEPDFHVPDAFGNLLFKD